MNARHVPRLQLATLLSAYPAFSFLRPYPGLLKTTSMRTYFLVPSETNYGLLQACHSAKKI